MRRSLVLALAITLAATALVWWWGLPPVEIPENELPQPTGYWRRGAPLEGDPEELARLLSLPYAAGTQAATIPGLGVVEYDRDRAQPGLNLYVSGHDSEALLIDREGVLKHRWRIEFLAAVPESNNATEHSYMRRAQLAADGDLIVLWQGQGLARIDLRSRLKWSRDIGVYNDLYYSEEDDSETLIVIHKLAESRPDLSDRSVLNDHLLWLDPATGETVRSISLLDALQRSEWTPALERRPDHPDFLHANTVTVLDEAAVEGSPFEPGWILFSLREISLVGVLDPDAEEIVWALQGPPFEAQHEPVLLPGGPDQEARVLLFDNKGPEGRRSRALELSLEGEVLWSWPLENVEDEAHRLASPLMGTVQRLTNGNTLIVESDGGSAVEVTPDGAIVWRFETPHRSGEQGRLIAVIPEMVRIPVPDWMEADRDGTAPAGQ